MQFVQSERGVGPPALPQRAHRRGRVLVLCAGPCCRPAGKSLPGVDFLTRATWEDDEGKAGGSSKKPISRTSSWGWSLLLIIKSFYYNKEGKAEDLKHVHSSRISVLKTLKYVSVRCCSSLSTPPDKSVSTLRVFVSLFPSNMEI